jgi:chromosome segregation ATPase
MNKKRDDLKREIEDQVTDELAKTERTQQQYEFYESEVEATLQRVREELTYMEQRQKNLSEEILQLKTQNAELRLNSQKDETELQVTH